MVEQIAKTIVNGVNLSLKIGDITLEDTDAIVNAANSNLMGGGGVDGAIHRAGGPPILKACLQIIAKQGPLATGKAVITTGGNLKARFVIHTVGPVWQGGKHDEPELLTSAYRESLNVAVTHKLKTVAFPSISTGAYRYPVGPAAEIAINTVLSFLKDAPGTLSEVTFVLFNQNTFSSYETALTKAVSML